VDLPHQSSRLLARRRIEARTQQLFRSGVVAGYQLANLLEPPGRGRIARAAGRLQAGGHECRSFGLLHRFQPLAAGRFARRPGRQGCYDVGGRLTGFDIAGEKLGQIVLARRLGTGRPCRQLGKPLQVGGGLLELPGGQTELCPELGQQLLVGR